MVRIGFDGGSIISFLRLDKGEFDKTVAEAEATKKDLEKDVTVPVQAEWDKEAAAVVEEEKSALGSKETVTYSPEMDKVAEAAVEAEKTLLAKGVDVPISPTISKTAPASLAKSMLGDPTVGAKAFGTDLGRALDAGLLDAIGPGTTENRNLRNTLANIFRSGSLPEKSLMGDMLSQFGFNPTDISHALDTVFNTSIAELGSGSSSRASALADALLPPKSDFEKALADGFYALMGDGSGGTNWEQKLLGVTALDALGNQAQIGKGKGGGGLIPASFEQKILDDIINSMMNTPGNKTGTNWKIPTKEWDLFTGNLFSKIATDAFGNQLQLGMGSASTASGADPVAKKTFSSIMGDVWTSIKSNVSAALAGGGGKNDKPPSWLTSWGSSFLGGGLKMPGPLPNGFLGAFSLTSLVPLMGALGLAGGGALAGTAIGGAGTLMALLPGMMDLTKGYAAYTALSTGASTKGMTAAQLALGKSLGGLLGAGGKGLGAAETAVMPQITKFLAALEKALPSIEKFGNVGIKAMSGFFAVIDKGLASKGFALFMTQMSKDLGPIMKDFGKTFINMGLVFGNFLKIFGGAPAKIVGAWFVKITGELANFSAHAKLGHGFIQGMKTAFGDLDPVLKLAWAAFKKVGDALAPLGFLTLGVVKDLAKLTLVLVHLIPTNFLTGVAGVVLAIMGIYKAIMIVRGGMIAFRTVAEAMYITSGPLALLVVALVAIGLGAYELYKHWNTVWNFIKRITLDAWHFLDDILHNKIVQGILFIVAPLVLLALHWKTVWHDITTVLKDAWKLIQPVLHLISAGISDVLNPVKTLMSVGGAIGHGLSSAWHAAGFANGGQPPVGVPSIVGENGPELFIPQSAGTIIPNGQFGGGVSIYVDARGSSDPGAVRTQAARGVSSSLPALQAALARGAA